MERNHRTIGALFGIAALSLGSLALVACSPAQGESRLPDIVLITIDTLRADHLGAYGHTQDVSPNIDALAASGVRFERALSQAPWTLPSMASLHTSLYPREHGAIGSELSLPGEATTLAEALRSEGYRTIGIVSNVFVSERHGLHQGFEVFDESNVAGHAAVTSRDLTDNALIRLRSYDSQRPLFLWIHYFDPHFTYVRHPKFARAPEPSISMPKKLHWRYLDLEAPSFGPAELAYIRGVYDEEIAYTDHHIGRLLDELEPLGFGDAIVALTSDHGEYFLERGRFGHGKDVYPELLHVPLIIAGPTERIGAPRVVSETVELTSVPRTLLTLAGLDASGFGGDDLLRLTAGTARVCFVEGGHAHGPEERKHAVVTERWKLVRHLDDGRLQLFDLANDPNEHFDLAPRPTEEAAAALPELEDALARYALRQAFTPASVSLDESEMEHLRQLGYAE